MNANEYQELAMRTAAGSRKQGDLNAIVVMALGLCGESAELLDEEADWRKEIGDCWWYAAVLARLLESNLSEYMPEDNWVDLRDDQPDQFAVENLFVAAGAIADNIKKVFGHGHELNAEELSRLLGIYVERLFVLSQGSEEAIWEANIEKLRKRYPNGFSSEASINRTE